MNERKSGARRLKIKNALIAIKNLNFGQISSSISKIAKRILKIYNKQTKQLKVKNLLTVSQLNKYKR